MKLFFTTAQGKYELQIDDVSKTIKEICDISNIPYQSMSLYGYRNSSDKDDIELFVGLHTPISEIANKYNQVDIQPDRNINYAELCLKDIKLLKKDNAVCEYSFPSKDNLSQLIHKEMDVEDCKEYVSKEVFSFLKEYVKPIQDKPVVIGVSGGGDSNTLISSFIKSGMIAREQIHAVMMLGVPDWDRGVDRAKEICRESDVKLTLVQPEEVAVLLGKEPKCDWISDFEKVFPDADLEVLGTLCIRLSLFSIARKIDAQAVVTGPNLEDLIAESYLSILSGVLPLPFPVRVIDNIPIWFPLYKCPKKILDGCYPKFSRQNYLDRYPSLMVGRYVPYFMAQKVSTFIPGVEFDLIKGFQSISKQNENFSFYDEELGFSTDGKVPLSVRYKWKEFISMGKK